MTRFEALMMNLLYCHQLPIVSPFLIPTLFTFIATQFLYVDYLHSLTSCCTVLSFTVPYICAYYFILQIDCNLLRRWEICILFLMSKHVPRTVS